MFLAEPGDKSPASNETSCSREDMDASSLLMIVTPPLSLAAWTVRLPFVSTSVGSMAEPSLSMTT